MSSTINLRKYATLAALALAASLPIASHAASDPTPGELAYVYLPDPTYQPVDSTKPPTATGKSDSRRAETVSNYTYFSW